MATINKLNFPVHTDYQVDHSIPDNQKLSAAELNKITDKIDEIITKTAGILQGVKVRQIELLQTEKIEDYTNSYVSATPKFFEVSNDEVIIIKHYLHAENGISVTGWQLSLFTKGGGKWGHPGNDNTITALNMSDFIFVNDYDEEEGGVWYFP